MDTGMNHIAVEVPVLVHYLEPHSTTLCRILGNKLPHLKRMVDISGRIPVESNYIISLIGAYMAK